MGVPSPEMLRGQFGVSKEAADQIFRDVSRQMGEEANAKAAKAAADAEARAAEAQGVQEETTSRMNERLTGQRPPPDVVQGETVARMNERLRAEERAAESRKVQEETSARVEERSRDLTRAESERVQAETLARRNKRIRGGKPKAVPAPTAGSGVGESGPAAAAPAAKIEPARAGKPKAKAPKAPEEPPRPKVVQAQRSDIKGRKQFRWFAVEESGKKHALWAADADAAARIGTNTYGKLSRVDPAPAYQAGETAMAEAPLPKARRARAGEPVISRGTQANRLKKLMARVTADQHTERRKFVEQLAAAKSSPAEYAALGIIKTAEQEAGLGIGNNTVAPPDVHQAQLEVRGHVSTQKDYAKRTFETRLKEDVPKLVRSYKADILKHSPPGTYDYLVDALQMDEANKIGPVEKWLPRDDGGIADQVQQVEAARERGLQKSVGSFATQEEAERAARAFDDTHLEAPEAKVIKRGGKWHVQVPENAVADKTPEEILAEQKARFEKGAANVIDPNGAAGERTKSTVEKIADVRAALKKKLPNEERIALRALLSGLERELAIQAGGKIAGLLALAGGAYALGRNKDDENPAAAGLAGTAALIGIGLLAGRSLARGAKFDLKDMEAGRRRLGELAEAARKRITPADTKALVEYANSLDQFSKGKLTPREMEEVRQRLAPHDKTIASFGAGYGVVEEGPRVGVRHKAALTVAEVMTKMFGPYGKILGAKMSRALHNSDMREGAVDEELKQIRIPGSKSAIHPTGLSALDRLPDDEYLNARDIWNWWSAKLSKGLPAGMLPDEWPKAPPKPMSKHVETIIDANLNHYFGRPFASKDPAVNAASKQLVELYGRVFPAFAKEAADWDIHVKGPDGKLYPFMERLGPNKTYMPHMMAQDVIVRPPSEIAKILGLKVPGASKKFIDQHVRAMGLRDIVAKQLARRYNVTEGEILKALQRADEERHMPWMKYTLDATIKNAGHLEYGRYIDSEFAMEIDPARFVPSYVRPAILRFEYAREFGRSGMVASQLIKAAGLRHYDATQMKEFFDLGMEQSPDLRATGASAGLLREVAGFASVSKLPLSGVSQLTSLFPLMRALRVYDNPVAKANWQSFFRGIDEGVNKSLVDAGLRTHQMDKVRAQLVSSTGAALEAERINWIMQLRGFFPKIATAALHLYGTVPLDRLMRNIAGASGRSYADVLAYEYLNAKRAGNVGKAREIEFRFQDLGIKGDGMTGKLDPVHDFARWDQLDPGVREEYRNLIGWTIAARTQHRTRAFDLPKLATDQYLKYIYKFSPFAIRQTVETKRQIWSEIVDRRPGEDHPKYVARSLRWLASLAPGVLGAYYLNKLRQVIREPDDQKRRRAAAEEPEFDKIVNLVGYANIAPWIFDWVQSAKSKGGLTSRLLGPVYGTMLEYGQYAGASLARGDPGPTLRYAIRQLGVPGISGSSGTPLGRILGVPSGREIIGDKGPPAEIRANKVPGLRHLNLGRVQQWPIIGPYTRKTKSGRPSYATAQMRSQYPTFADFLLGRPKAKKRK
jgi:hypothetical protein